MVAVITAPEDGQPPVDSYTESLVPQDITPNMAPDTPPTKKRRVPRQTRQTVQWPFQSTSLEDNSLPALPILRPPLPILPGPNKFVSDAMMPSPKVAYFPRPDTTARPAPTRPVTWQPRARIPKGFGNSSFGDSEDDEQERGTIRRSLIPDYVINYLRGDTPETIAQRVQEKQEQKKDGTVPTGNGEPHQADELHLRGGGSPMHIGDIDHTNMPSPGYRTSEEPILRRGRGTYTYGIYSEKRRSVLSNGRRRAQRQIGQSTQGSFFARGWRAGMALHALVALVLFIAGLIGLALALTTPHGHTAAFPGRTVVLSCTQSQSDGAPCSSAYHVLWVLRAVLAVCTLAILAGAQYTFHVLSSPTRAEIDTAHTGTPTGLLSPRRNRSWLNIGVPSLRNIAFLLRHKKTAEEDGGGARFRAVLAIVAVATALATSVLYGSLIDITISTPLGAQPAYSVLLVAPSFIDGAPFSNGSANNAGRLDRLSILQLQQAASKTHSSLRNLTADDCLRTRSSSTLQNELSLFETGVRWNNVSAALIILNDAAVTTLRVTNTSVIQTAPPGSRIEHSDSIGTSLVFELDKSLSVDKRSTVTLDNDAVAFCLVQESSTGASSASDATSLIYSTTLNTPLLAITLGLNVFTMICFAFALLRSANPSFRQTPLITFGDAVASFLRDPDHTTRGACLLSKKDIKNGVWNRMADDPQLTVKTSSRGSGAPQSTRSMGIGAAKPENVMQPMFIAPKAGDSSPDYYWFRSVSRAQWLTGTLAWLALVGFAVAGLAVSVPTSDTLGSLGQFVLDDFTWGLLASPTSNNTSSPVSSYATLLASLPQLGLGILYLLVDAHLCAYFLSHESSSYIANQNIFDDIQLQQYLGGRKALRVSYRPRGHQRTSLYLTQPHVWNWLLLVLFSGLSFALGQSLVVTGLAASTDSSQIMLLGFSATGFVVLLVLLLLAAVLVLGLGTRRTPPPPGSLAVSAMRAASSPSAPPAVRRNPLTMPGGSCSAVISARCHPLPEEMPTETTSANPGSSSTGGPLPLWLRPLAWGPAPSYQHPYQGYNRRHVQPHASDDGEDDNIDSIVGHCTFSNGPLVPLDTARSYA
ncbi:hypothetical protein F503_00075 [Ophiostoma piceae UAMH 11346]|uniref:DUF6536 domain-containing protein n=1 Tax=Ophiostoma piceae (strain UAMH 11346) TaxID=1262450 RepID=S3BZN5_OPHP1|nr:hypothetical protein F503_00075 [Ophiostoma piceae UAMH 11346]